MPVRVSESSLPSQISGSSSGQTSPPPCSLLGVGQAFSGTQNVSSVQKDEAWRVNVRIQGCDLEHGYLCGTMEALNVPMADTPVVTFWEGEIVDTKNFTFFTGKWEATPEDDIRHWTKFPSFAPLLSQVEVDGGKSLDLSNYPYIFMRWKEQYFVNVGTDCGLTIAGFYYVCFSCSDGSINGFYYDPNSSPFQKLELKSSNEGRSGAVQVIIVNNCNQELWPAILGNPGQQNPKDGGFHLSSGEEVVLDLPEKWAGRLWGRQGCNFDNEGKGECETGDCSGQIHCQGASGTPPATVVEMTFGSSVSPLHYYDVSLVDGFNLPVSMKPVGGGVGCGVAKCDADLNVCCPSALEVRKGNKVVGCKSACLAMQSAKYCCTGEFSNPKTCKPTVFANLFKAICPKAYTYAFDDSSSLNRCRAPRYVVTFCPPN